MLLPAEIRIISILNYIFSGTIRFVLIWCFFLRSMRRMWSAVSHQRNRFVPSKHKIQAIVCCLWWWASEITLLLLSQEIHLFSQETHLPETICVYQFGPGVTQQKADAWCGQFKGGQKSTCWQPQWHQIVVSSRTHHCTSRTLSLIHEAFCHL